MGIFKKIISGMSICVLASLALPCRIVSNAADYNNSYKVQYDVPIDERDKYNIIAENLGTYKVDGGDSLWSISEKFFGDGKYYLQLKAHNKDVITNPDLIYPGMELGIIRDICVKKSTGNDGIKTNEYLFGIPDNSKLVMLGEGNVYANFTLSGKNSGKVTCLIRDKKEGIGDGLSDWDSGRQTISEYVKKNYSGKSDGNQVSDLTFDRYGAEDRDIYMFSYIYTISGEQYGYQGTIDICVCHGICQTEHVQAEFTGFNMDSNMENIHNIILYMCGSFEELFEPGQSGYTANNYNIKVEPSEPWALSGVHNPFVWIEKYYDAVSSKISGKAEKTKSLKERLLK